MSDERNVESLRRDIIEDIDAYGRVVEHLAITVAEHIQLDGAHPVERIDGVLLGCRKTSRWDTREPYRDGEVWVATQETDGQIYGNRSFVTNECIADPESRVREQAKEVLVRSIVVARSVTSRVPGNTGPT